jgi:hypothetical protein
LRATLDFPREDAVQLNREELLRAYRSMATIRRFEERVQEEFSKGGIPGFVHLYAGEEASAVGMCQHLGPKDYIASTHRGHGHSIAKGCDVVGMMQELFGKEGGLCGGKGGSMHIADLDQGMLGANGIVGGGPPLVVGAALTAKTLGTGTVAVCFSGDGASNQGTTFEALNMAVVLKLPAIFVFENNQYGEGTPFAYAVGSGDIAGRAAGFGLPAVKVNGDDFFEVHDAAAEAIERARSSGGPSAIESTPAASTAPLGRCATLSRQGTVCAVCARDHPQHCLKAFPAAGSGEAGLLPPGPRLDPSRERGRRAARPIGRGWQERPPNLPFPKPCCATSMSLTEGARDGTQIDPGRRLNEAARPGNARDPPSRVGEESCRGRRRLARPARDAYGRVLGVTKGLIGEFGEGRVIDTPITESAIMGAAAGAAVTGLRPVAELMFSDFLGVCFDQIFNQAAKFRYMFGGKAKTPMVIRTMVGAGRSAAAQHSQSPYHIFTSVPGLKVVVPSNAYDAKGPLIQAIRDDDPVIFCEHNSMYDSARRSAGRALYDPVRRGQYRARR